jgi:hypothetical protein
VFPLTEEEKAEAGAMWEAMTGGDYDDKKKRQEKAILVEKDLSADLWQWRDQTA